MEIDTRGAQWRGLNWMSRWPICPEERESRMGKKEFEGR